MPTRIDKKISQNLDIVNNPSSLQSYLTRRGGRKINDIKYIGLVRDNALSDINEPNVAFTNVLEAITKIPDAAEIANYGTYKPIDFNITGDFIEYEISRSFLSPLKNASILGGVFGANTSVNPRIRIQDRISQLNSFAGEGSLDNLHSGPVALFYEEPRGEKAYRTVLTTKLDSYSSISGKGIILGSPVISDLTNILSTSTRKIFLNLLKYKTYDEIGTNILVEEDFSSSEIYCYLIQENGNYVIYIKSPSETDIESRSLFNTLFSGLSSVKNRTEFIFGRPYSRKYAPDWYIKSPNDAQVSANGGPDDADPNTTYGLLSYNSGTYSLYTERGYYETGSHIETRTIPEFRDVYNGNNVVLDSNMVFESAPPAINASVYNWGVRWDGYLRVDSDDFNDQVHAFEIETNTQIKIDLASETDSQGNPKWVNVFDTYLNNNSAVFADERDRFISKNNFRLNDLHEKFIHYTNETKTAGRRYVPISIRVFNGSTDISYKEESSATPNIFLKLGTKSGTQSQTFYGGDAYVNISTISGTSRVVQTSSEFDSLDNIPFSEIANNLNAAYKAEIIQKSEERPIVSGVNEITKQPEISNEFVFTTLETPIEVRFAIDETNVVLKDIEGNDISIGSLVDGTYLIRLNPDRDYSTTVLWSRFFVSPQRNYNGYNDLINFNENQFTPSVYKNTFDTKPEWWKISTGNRYLVGDTINKDNDPLDGFLSLYFRSTLSPRASNIGLYGDGAGNYTPRNNLILGEARYLTSDIPGSNYIGLKITKNKLGEGGRLVVRSIPITNASLEFPNPVTTSDSKTTLANAPLGASDLGGSPNHQTKAYSSYNQFESFKVYWNTNILGFVLHDLTADPPVPPTQDDTSFLGLPSFTDNLGWSQPLKLICAGFSTTVDGALTSLAAQLDLAVYRATYDPDNGQIDLNATSISGNKKWIFVFKSTHPAAATTLDKKFLRAYSESDLVYSFSLVDNGDALSFSDCLKLSYILEIKSQGSGYTDNTYQNIELKPISGTGSSSTNPTVDITVSGGVVSSITMTNNPSIEVGTEFELVTSNALGSEGSGFKASYQFISGSSEVPKGAAERALPFGSDRSDVFSSLVCYPPYTVSDPFLEDIAVNDVTLYQSEKGFFDVFWGDFFQKGNNALGGHILSITQKLEFVFNKNLESGEEGEPEDPSDIIKSVSGITLNASSYTHQLKVELPLFNPDAPTVPYDEDIYVHIGNRKRINDTYYLYVNGRVDPSIALPSSGVRDLLPGLS